MPVCLLAAALAGCASAPQNVVPTDTVPVDAKPIAALSPGIDAVAPEQAIPALIATERQAAIDGDLVLLSRLWAPDARIVDGRGTPDSADDYVWQGCDAILDRYALSVFPAPPPPLSREQLADLVLTVEGDAAHAELGVDRWRFVRQNGHWLLAELRYN